MSEDQEQEKVTFDKKIAKYLPSVEKPTYKQSFNSRLKWTFFALIMYLVLSYVTAFGVQKESNPQFRFFELVLGSRFGSLMTLGIGPIVTAGIVLQLLVGSKILNWDTHKEEGRKKFQTFNKLAAIVLSFIEAAAFTITGAVPIEPGIFNIIIVMLQFAFGGIIALLLDEIVSKWGFGSGISLFIAVGVSAQIFVRILSPLSQACIPGNLISCIPSSGAPPTGLLWEFFISIFAGDSLTALLSILPVISTVLVFLIVIYIQALHIDIPLSFATVRGFNRNWPLKLLYTSNIPVILAAALIANLQLMARIGATADPTTGLICGIIGCVDASGQAVSGLVFYLSAPANLLGDLVSGSLVSSELTRAFTY